MNIDDPRILALKDQVCAAREEFDAATAYHEAWKPAAYDKALNERMSHSYAGNIFLVVRQVLRREMLLALMRLWDDDGKRAIQMKAIAKALGNQEIMDRLTPKHEADWIKGFKGLAEIDGTARGHIQAETGEITRGRAAQAIEIIHKYDQGGECNATLKKLKALRNERLAHRQIKATQADVRGGDATDAEIEVFYQDMSRLISLLLGCVVKMAYEPSGTAEVFGFYAKFFWDGVRSEQIEGHPNYRRAASISSRVQP